MRWAGALLGVVAALGAVLIFGTSSGPGPELQATSSHGWIVAVEPGQVFTDGFEVLKFRGEGVVRLQEVRFEGDAQLELAGALVAPPEARAVGMIQFDPQFPPHAPDWGDVSAFEPLAGFEISSPTTPVHPDGLSGHELVLGIEAPTAAGEYRRTAVIVNFEANGRQRTARLPAELIVCVGLEPVAGEFRCEDTPG